MVYHQVDKEEKDIIDVMITLDGTNDNKVNCFVSLFGIIVQKKPPPNHLLPTKKQL